MIQPILIWPDPTLHEVSAPVEEGEDVAQVVEDLLDTMYAAGGVGLSAIQIGVPLRIFVMDVADEDVVFLNPKIVVMTGRKAPVNEGCLSLPGIFEVVERYPTVVVQALDRNGESFTVETTGIAAQCVQHEIEHLDGVVMPDKFSKERQELIRLKLKHWKPKARKPPEVVK